jgi:anti-sigma28 factor (negative regulator of flagellin synthesis)
MRVDEAYPYLPYSSIKNGLADSAKKPSEHTHAISGEDSSSGGIGAAAAEQSAARVEELRRQVESGTYNVDVPEVVKDIIDKHLDS